MNTYDPNIQPGSHFVADTLGVWDVSMLNTTYPRGGPLYRAATRVIGAAYDLNELHNRVTHAAQGAHWLLEPAARGELDESRRTSYARLRTSVRKVGDLLARRNRAYDQLVESVSAYQRLRPDPDTAQSSATTAHELGRAQSSGRDDDWSIEGDRQLRALEAVELGGLRVCRTAIGEDPYLSADTGRQPQPLAATVRRMVSDGLLHQDTSENPYRPGQLLSLTSHGEAALRAARTSTSRVSAALGRSNAPTNPGPRSGRGLSTDSASPPVTTTVGNPSRSR
ncbi:hypothetical protein YW5DRAFT_03850 [Streptomyces sp. Ncost-T6T-1]|uniref:hypothetical protein n=1 Tax=Streptomyces sp. Ncost-T6T-1 TaxID=1100828 RepID=UPI000805851B|nr:hypothetical protein [Streptomyces sp. Ncost-T6T-1]SBU92113.1 hypothetical protein YW5DRAFT_03850 [Streptomyces sp. Ncost-T6T-1]